MLAIRDRKRVGVAMGVAAVLALLASCFKGLEPDCSITCTTSCPGNLRCDGAFCRPPGATGACSQADGDAGSEQCSDPVSIAAGDAFTCVVTSGGKVRCWGGNERGQLGHSLGPRVSQPMPVENLPDESFVEVAAGSYHACARTAEGAVYCWGDNSKKQAAGGAAAVAQATRIDIGAAAQLALGAFHSCALLQDGAIRCWGRQSLNGGEGAISTPDLPEARAVSAGASHTCALTEETGSVYCWGQNSHGQVGVPTAPSSLVDAPTEVPSIDGQARLALGGDTTCVLDSDGVVQCWGRNDESLLGSDIPATNDPQTIDTKDAIVDLVLGPKNACALRDGADPVCWGDNTRGQLTGVPGSDIRSPQPIPVGSLTAAAVGTDHFCGIDGTSVVCWGLGSRGQRAILANLVGLPQKVGTFSQVAAGVSHTCARDGSSTACWGSNLNNALGLIAETSIPESSSPQPLDGSFTDLSAGLRTTCANVGTQPVCWGRGGDGTLGDGGAADSAAPVNVVAPQNEITDRTPVVGYDQAFGVGTNLLGWGNNLNGQLGTSSEQALSAEEIAIAAEVTSIDGDFSHTCAATTEDVFCWGQDLHGKLGVSAEDDSTNEPIAINFEDSTATTAQRIGVGARHTCAVGLDGNVYCWGQGQWGQTGLSSTEDYPTPQPAINSNSETFVDVKCGERHSCALTDGDKLYCWGSDLQGQLGLGTGLDRQHPTMVPLSGVIDFSLGAFHTCAVVDGPTLYCWGDNSDGQIGVGLDLLRAPNRRDLCE